MSSLQHGELASQKEMLDEEVTTAAKHARECTKPKRKHAENGGSYTQSLGHRNWFFGSRAFCRTKPFAL